MDRNIRRDFRCFNIYSIFNIWRIFTISLVMVFSSIVIFLIKFWWQNCKIKINRSLIARFQNNEFKTWLKNIHIHFIIIFRKINMLSMLSIEKKWHTFECLRRSGRKTWIRFRYSQMDKRIQINEMLIR